MNDIQLSERLIKAAGFVTPGSFVVDVGTDHGFVPIYLIKEKIARHVIAMDVNEGPLGRAREHVAEYKLEDEIELRLSDGLKALNHGEADTMICAGMGGLLMLRILQEGQPVKKGINHLILQPQSDLFLFRKTLFEQNLFIEDEREVFEDGKYYTIMSVKTDIQATESAYENAAGMLMESCGCDKEHALVICHRFGPALILKRDPVLKDYLLHEKDICEKILLKLSEVEHTDRMRDIINKKNDITIVAGLY